MERIKECLEELDVYYKIKPPTEDICGYGLIEFWTDTAGQDILIEIDFDGTAEDFVKEFCKEAEKYNVDEEVEIYVDMRGRDGVPNTVRELLDDCQEAKDKLMEIAEKLKEALKEDEDE